ncbi:MAG: NADPH:quinone oxidoreductase family protein [bacterium]|nr:NADPH:quinone oxidoreductase family protein [bacterium]
MKAQVVHEFGPFEGLRYEDVDPPAPGPRDVLIGVEAVGLNFPDILMIGGLYQDRPCLPFVAGTEAAGRVLALGGEVSHLSVGDRVMGFNLLSGAMAEQFVVPADRTFALPDEVTMEQGACMALTYGTGYHALVDRARLAPGENLLITGAMGGVGSAAIQIGKALGARVIAAVSSDAKAEAATELGADATINYSAESLKERTKELTGGVGADVIYDPVGGDTFLECLRCVNWEGRILVVGFTSGRIPKAPTNLPLLKGSSIVGVFWGAYADRDPEGNRANFARLLEWTAKGVIGPRISARFPLESAIEALSVIANRRVTGKVVLIP